MAKVSREALAFCENSIDIREARAKEFHLEADNQLLAGLDAVAEISRENARAEGRIAALLREVYYAAKGDT